MCIRDRYIIGYMLYTHTYIMQKFLGRVITKHLGGKVILLGKIMVEYFTLVGNNYVSQASKDIATQSGLRIFAKWCVA